MIAYVEKYKTILAQAEAEIVEKKSRFIATVRPVKTEEEARSFIDELKKKYWDATHNVLPIRLVKEMKSSVLVTMVNPRAQRVCRC